MSSNILVVDVGNTNIVLGLYRGDELVSSWRSPPRASAPPTSTASSRGNSSARRRRLEGAMVASVVPPLNGVIAAWCASYFDIDPLFVEPGVKTGIAIHVDNPQEVGADRIVNCVAAFERIGGPSVIVDFGTATTFDLVTEMRSTSAA
jgi:type III pantothenate kinase